MSEWTPQEPHKEVPVLLTKPPGYTEAKPKTRHPNAACWYRLDEASPEGFITYVFTVDTAGTWWDDGTGEYGVNVLWDLTKGGHQNIKGFFRLLGRISEHIEQGVFPDDEACIETRDELIELIQELR